MKIRDRIKELRRVPASQLFPNPRNWRTHSEAQRNALQGVLAEVGYAGALLARELPDGSLELIDGHLRAETTPDMPVPVLVLDVNEDEAKLILATHDPLAGMAGVAAETLDALLAEIHTDNPAVQAMWDSLTAARRYSVRRLASGAAQGSNDRSAISSRRRMRERSRTASSIRTPGHRRPEVPGPHFVRKGLGAGD